MGFGDFISLPVTASKKAFDFADNLFGSNPAGGGVPKGTIDQSQYNSRSADIDKFEKQLSEARGNYESSLRNMYSTAFNQYMPNIEAQYAGHGMQVSGGGFASALAKVSAMNTAQMLPQVYDAQRQDLNTVQGYRNSLFGAQTGANNAMSMANLQNDYSSSMYDRQRQDQMMGQLGGFAMNAGLLYATGGMSGAGGLFASGAGASGMASPSMFRASGGGGYGTGMYGDKLGLNWGGR